MGFVPDPVFTVTFGELVPVLAYQASRDPTLISLGIPLVSLQSQDRFQVVTDQRCQNHPIVVDFDLGDHPQLVDQIPVFQVVTLGSQADLLEHMCVFGHPLLQNLPTLFHFFTVARGITSRSSVIRKRRSAIS